MGENLTNIENSGEQEEKIYSSLGEYVLVFEESQEFEKALDQRKYELKIERPDINLEKEDLAESMRKSPIYRYALIDFYKAGHKLPANIENYSPEAQVAIQEYWDFIKAMPRHIDVVRATAKDKEDEEIKVFRMEKTRDRFHTIAGLALLGEGIELSNGQKITCEEFSQDDSALDLASYSVLGRCLVSIITEENALDIVDPEREEKKTAATLNFLNSCHYSSGHWVGKGER